MNIRAPTHKAEARRFVRHPTGLPVWCRASDQDHTELNLLHDVSYGGVGFYSHGPYHPGEILFVSVPNLEYPTLRTEVVWCSTVAQTNGQRFICGVKFLDEAVEAQTRMVDDIGRVESYRRAQKLLHRRDITSEVAAMEWKAYAGLEMTDKQFEQHLTQLIAGRPVKIWLAKSNAGRLDTIFSVGTAQGEEIENFDHLGGYYLLGEGVPPDLLSPIHDLFVNYCMTQKTSLQEQPHHQVDIFYRRAQMFTQEQPSRPRMVLHFPFTQSSPVS